MKVREDLLPESEWGRMELIEGILMRFSEFVDRSGKFEVFPNHFDERFFNLADISSEEEEAAPIITKFGERENVNASPEKSIGDLEKLGRLGPFETRLDLKYQTGLLKLSNNNLTVGARGEYCSIRANTCVF
jgi:hypothetical protein